ncbi:MAG TPA: FecR domain-containing protein [Kofleriaceae bacterium]|nr:FecR domain-containing protein [Kofleriaceae bacterium]
MSDDRTPEQVRAELALRVLAARGRSVIEPPPEAHVPAARPRSLRWSVVLLAAIGAVMIVLASRRSVPDTIGGAVEATERTTHQIGRRGVAVLEPGAAIRWIVERGGETLVWQPRGEVFYRFDRGRNVRVETPAARIDVLGTSFRVISDGAARLTVRVDEGRVRVTANDGRQQEAGPGENIELSATASSNTR